MSYRGDRVLKIGEVVVFSDSVQAVVNYPWNEWLSTDPTRTLSETGGILFGVSVDAVDDTGGRIDVAGQRKRTVTRPPGCS